MNLEWFYLWYLRIKIESHVTRSCEGIHTTSKDFKDNSLSRRYSSSVFGGTTELRKMYCVSVNSVLIVEQNHLLWCAFIRNTTMATVINSTPNMALDA